MLGAWGTGVFRNPIEEVANQWFKRALDEITSRTYLYKDLQVIFAVPKEYPEKVSHFAKAFQVVPVPLDEHAPIRSNGLATVSAHLAKSATKGK